MADEPQQPDGRLAAAQAYFRDEMRRTVGWRDRLDRTSNWAVVMTATLLTWAFTRPDNPHYVVLIAICGVTFFLWAEVRRYRRYDIWRSRIRLIERDILAPCFDPERRAPDDRWKLLADDLAEPSLKVPFFEALQRRLRRMYAGLLYLLLVAWVLKVGAGDKSERFVASAGVDPVPGAVVVGAVAAFAVALTAIVVWPNRRRAMEGLSDRDVGDGAWEESGDDGSARSG